MSEFKFTSVFAPYFYSYLRMKSSLGVSTVKVELFFKELDDLYSVMNLEEPIITRPMVDTWRDSRVNDSERTLYNKWSMFGQFARYMCHCGQVCYVPIMPRHKQWGFTPRIYTRQEILELFAAADNLVLNNNRNHRCLFSIPAIIRLLYATGMRVGEAVSLTNGDVDLDTGNIVIKKTKNHRERLIPMSGSLKNVLMQYVGYRNKLPIKNIKDARNSFFVNTCGEPIQKVVVYNWFRKLLKKCGIPFVGSGKGPRLHDLRHTFAVHSLESQIKAGRDLYYLLPVLSVVMGHKSLSGTEAYVRLTAEVFPEISEIVGEYSSIIFPTLNNIDHGK